MRYTQRGWTAVAVAAALVGLSFATPAASAASTVPTYVARGLVEGGTVIGEVAICYFEGAAQAVLQVLPGTPGPDGTPRPRYDVSYAVEGCGVFADDCSGFARPDGVIAGGCTNGGRFELRGLTFDDNGNTVRFHLYVAGTVNPCASPAIDCLGDPGQWIVAGPRLVRAYDGLHVPGQPVARYAAAGSMQGSRVDLDPGPLPSCPAVTRSAFRA